MITIGLILLVLIVFSFLLCSSSGIIIIEPPNIFEPQPIEVVEATLIRDYLPFSFSDDDIITSYCQSRCLTNERVPGPNAYAYEGFLVFNEQFTIDPQLYKAERTEDEIKELLNDSKGKAIPIFNEIEFHGDGDNWKEISDLKSVPSESVWVYYRETDRTLIFRIAHFN